MPLIDPTTTPVQDLLLWAHLDFVVTIGAAVAALANVAAIWRNLVLTGRLLKQLAEHAAAHDPPGETLSGNLGERDSPAQ